MLPEHGLSLFNRSNPLALTWYFVQPLLFAPCDFSPLRNIEQSLLSRGTLAVRKGKPSRCISAGKAT